MANEVNWQGEMMEQLMEQQQLMNERLQMMEQQQQVMSDTQQQMIHQQHVMEQQVVRFEFSSSQMQRQLQQQMVELSQQRHMNLQREFERRRMQQTFQEFMMQRDAGAGDAADEAGYAADDVVDEAGAVQQTRVSRSPRLGQIIEEAESYEGDDTVEAEGKSSTKGKIEGAEDKRCETSGSFMQAVEEVEIIEKHKGKGKEWVLAQHHDKGRNEGKGKSCDEGTGTSCDKGEGKWKPSAEE